MEKIDVENRLNHARSAVEDLQRSKMALTSRQGEIVLGWYVELAEAFLGKENDPPPVKVEEPKKPEVSGFKKWGDQEAAERFRQRVLGPAYVPPKNLPPSQVIPAAVKIGPRDFSQPAQAEEPKKESKFNGLKINFRS